MFNPVYSGPRPEPMAVGAFFGSRRRKIQESTMKCGILPEEEIRGMKLFAASTDAKDERGIEKFRWPGKTQPNPHDQSTNDRNQKEEAKDEPQTKESDDDHFQTKRRDETK